MKTQIKRTVSVVMAILMLVALVTISDLGVTAQAAETGTFKYEVSNGEATIVRFYYGEYDDYDEDEYEDEDIAVAAYVDDSSYDEDEDESYGYKYYSHEYDSDLVIPDTLGGYPVTHIGYEAFYGCTGLTSITIPDSVTNIGGSAFGSCTGLKSITIPDSVTSIGSSAFYNTAYYNNSSNWKNGVLYIGNHLIKADNYSIKGSYKIKSGTKCIADYAFWDCTDLKSITIPNSVTSIGDSAFYECTGLKSITISDGVTSIGNSAFEDCSSLKSIKIGNSVTIIGRNAFYDCSSLTSITIPDSVTNIGSSAFEDCTDLKSITIPDSVTSIGEYAFYNTAYYNDSSNWKNGVLYIGNHLIKADNYSIKGSYKIKSGTKCIADYAFWDCTDLKSITIPNSVTSIGYYAFYDCESLESITIPDSVTSISNYAFYGCSSLKSVTIPASVTDIGYEAFGYCDYDELYDFIISGYVGTAAEQYADENEFKFIDLATHTHTHSYTSKVTKKATCTKSGTRTYTCECGDSYTEKIDSLGHNYSSKWTVDKKATCTKAGSKSHHCTRCSAKSAVTTIKATGHSYKTTTVKATTSKSGSKTTKCTVCGNVKSKSTIAKISSITLSHDTFTYSGKVKQPTVTVKDSKGNTLKKGTDYTVKYSSGRKNVGKYTVTVTFKGKYSGTKKLTFKIKPKSTSISKLTAGKKQFTATWYKRTEQTSGYQLEYSTSSSMKNASKKTYTTTSKNTRTITGLKSAKKYYVRIRTYKNVKINGKTYKYYSSWSSIKSVKTK